DCAGNTPFCAKASVNLWEPEMPWGVERLTFTTYGKDLTNNAGMYGTAETMVTRLKWARQVDTNAVKASPAIASDGTIIVGSTNGTTTGKLQALKPDGTLLWEKLNLGALSASPAIGKGTQVAQVAFAGVTSASGAEFVAIDLATSSVDKTCGPYAGG